MLPRMGTKERFIYYLLIKGEEVSGRANEGAAEQGRRNKQI